MNRLTKTELINLAKSYNLRISSRLRKSQIIDLIKDYLEGFELGSQSLNLNQPIDLLGSSSSSVSPIIRNISDVPEYYGQDEIYFFPVNPSKQFVEWELSTHTHASNMVRSGVNNPEYIIKIISSNGIELANQAVHQRGDWYFYISAPFESVYAELGSLDKNGSYYTLLRTDPVVLPSGTISSNLDVSWMAIADDWDYILELSGLDQPIQGSSEKIQLAKKAKKILSSSDILFRLGGD